MLSQDRISKLLGDLKILSSLTPGKTISESTMSVIDHNTWSGTFWRTYAGENRKQTVAYVKGILLEALSILKLYDGNSYNNEIFISLETATRGFAFLKETYKGDYYIIADIDSIIESIKKELQIIREYLFDSRYTQIQRSDYNPDMNTENYYADQSYYPNNVADTTYNYVNQENNQNIPLVYNNVQHSDNPVYGYEKQEYSPVNYVHYDYTLSNQGNGESTDSSLMNPDNSDLQNQTEIRKENIKQRRCQLDARRNELLNKKNSSKSEITTDN
jgi:hypothetical protein